MKVNPRASNTPTINKRYNLSDKALEQRRMAARRPRSGKRQLFLKLTEKVFDRKFQRALIRSFTTALEEECRREFIGVKKL